MFKSNSGFLKMINDLLFIFIFVLMFYAIYVQSERLNDLQKSINGIKSQLNTIHLQIQSPKPYEKIVPGSNGLTYIHKEKNFKLQPKIKG